MIQSCFIIPGYK